MAHYELAPLRACHAEKKCRECFALATSELRLETLGRHGRVGSRCIGLYCERHAQENLQRLRKKAGMT